MSDIPIGLCHCGCGEKAPVAIQTTTKLGKVRGQPHQFVAGHSSRGKHNPTWKGGKHKTRWGYILVYQPQHPRALNGKYVFEHILVAEKALGKHLPEKAVVHYVNAKRDDNASSNLVICQNEGYHRLLHRRLDAYRESGHAHWRRCVRCGKLDDPTKLILHSRQKESYVHRLCRQRYGRESYTAAQKTLTPSSRNCGTSVIRTP